MDVVHASEDSVTVVNGTAYGLSNGHVTPNGAVRQYGRLS